MPTAKRSPRLKALLSGSQRLIEQANKAYTRAEARLTEQEQREARERARENR